MDHDSVSFGETPRAATSQHRNPISIAMMFYILTLAAILAACLGRMSNDTKISTGSLTASIEAGSFLGLVIGVLGGAFYFKSAKATAIGAATGALLGTVAGPLTIIGESNFSTMMTITYCGCWLLMVVMLLAARWQGSR